MRALSYPFRVNTQGGLASTTDYTQIVRGQIIDALMTNLGERVMRPRYGCDVQSAVFDPSDELQRRDAAGQLKSRLSRLVPRAIVESVTLVDGQEPGTYLFDVSYRPAPYAEATNVVIPVASEFINRQIALERALD